MIGEINFPNLQFDYTTIDFGTVLNDTTQTVSVKVTNISKIDTDLSWTFEADEESARKKATATSHIYLLIKFTMFYIGFTTPGETEVVEFAFYGHANGKFAQLQLELYKGGLNIQ